MSANMGSRFSLSMDLFLPLKIYHPHRYCRHHKAFVKHLICRRRNTGTLLSPQYWLWNKKIKYSKHFHLFYFSLYPCYSSHLIREH